MLPQNVGSCYVNPNSCFTRKCRTKYTDWIQGHAAINKTLLFYVIYHMRNTNANKLPQMARSIFLNISQLNETENVIDTFDVLFSIATTLINMATTAYSTRSLYMKNWNLSFFNTWLFATARPPYIHTPHWHNENLRTPLCVLCPWRNVTNCLHYLLRDDAQLAYPNLQVLVSIRSRFSYLWCPPFA